MNFGSAARFASSHALTFCGPPISSNCRSTSSFAPPCSAPDSAPMAPAIVWYGPPGSDDGNDDVIHMPGAKSERKGAAFEKNET